MDVGYDVESVRSDAVGIGNDIVCIGNNLLGGRNVVTNVGNGNIGIHRKLCLKRTVVKEMPNSDEVGVTHIEYVKDPVELRLPGRDFFLFTLPAENSRNLPVAFAVLDQFPLDHRDGAMKERESTS